MACLVASLGALALLGSTGESHAKPTVILLSLDGVRHDYPDRASFPALERMENGGIRAGRLRPVFPSNTFPNHVSLATGTYPDRHGILDNRFWDRDKGLYDYGKGADSTWLEAEPLWAAAERQGIPAATFFWVGSETPWRGQAVHHVKAPFDGEVPEREKVAQILAWLDLPEKVRPGLIMSWWHGADGAGHRFGPDGPEVVEALEEQDAELGRLLAGIDARTLWDELTLIVVSDHGMIGVGERVAVDDMLENAGIPAKVNGSSVAHVFLDDPGDLATARSLLARDKALRVYPGRELPEEFRIRHPRRSGDLVVVVDAPRTFHEPDLIARTYLGLRRLWVPDARFGMHGFAPDHPAMGAIFFALGSQVEAGGHPAEVRSIDVAASVAHLLGIDPPAQSEGRPIPGLGDALP